MAVEDGEERTVTLPEDEWFRLKQEALLTDLEVKLDARLKRRFTILLVIVAVVSAFGIHTITRNVIDSRIEPQVLAAEETVKKVEVSTIIAAEKINLVTKQAEKATENSSEALKKSTNALSKIEELLKKIELREEIFNEQLSSLADLENRYEGRFNDLIKNKDGEWKIITSKYLQDVETYHRNWSNFVSDKENEYSILEHEADKMAKNIQTMKIQLRKMVGEYNNRRAELRLIEAELGKKYEELVSKYPDLD